MSTVVKKETKTTMTKLAITDSEQGSANFICKGPYSKYVELYGPYGLCCNNVAWLKSSKVAIGNTSTNEGGWAPGTLFTDTEMNFM